MSNLIQREAASGFPIEDLKSGFLVSPIELFRFATAGVAMAPSVVHGMLAAIGVIIISKQSHVLLGVAPTAKEPPGLLSEIPNRLMHMNPDVALIGAAALLILFGMPLLPFRCTRNVPAPLIVLAVAVSLGIMFDLGHDHIYQFWGESFQLGPKALVALAGSILDAIAFPDFSQISSDISIKHIFMFALVGVGAGLVLELVIHAIRGAYPATLVRARVDRSKTGDELRLTLRGAAAFPSLLKVRRELATIDSDIRRIVIDLTDVRLVDHTFLCRIEAMAAEFGPATLESEGLHGMRVASSHPQATRRKPVPSIAKSFRRATESKRSSSAP